MRATAAIIGLLLLSTVAFAQELNPFAKAERIPIQSDRAYILIRAIVPKGAYATRVVLLRALNADELRGAVARRDRNGVYREGSNVLRTPIYNPNTASADTEDTYLLIAEPGAYVVAGQAFLGAMGTCMCLGTSKIRSEGRCGY